VGAASEGPLFAELADQYSLTEFTADSRTIRLSTVADDSSRRLRDACQAVQPADCAGDANCGPSAGPVGAQAGAQASRDDLKCASEGGEHDAPGADTGPSNGVARGGGGGMTVTVAEDVKPKSNDDDAHASGGTPSPAIPQDAKGDAGAASGTPILCTDSDFDSDTEDLDS
jgi:hypothetical protein